MGRTYRGRDLERNVRVTIKEMMPQPGLDPATLDELRRNFWQTGRMLTELDHPHLAQISDYFEDGSNAYLVMDFVEGEDLARRIARTGAAGESLVLAWAGQLLDALAYCHGKEVLHLDIKPENIIIQPDKKAVLVDLGLIPLWNLNDPQTQKAIERVGISPYAPPEHHQAMLNYSDLYSLGAVLYFALTGQAPPPAAELAKDDQRLAQTWNVINPPVSAATQAAIMQAMTVSPPWRFTDAGAMRAALPPPKAEAPPKPKGMAGWMWAVLLLLAGAIVAGLGLTVWQAAQPNLPATETAVVALFTATPTPTLTPTETATPAAIIATVTPTLPPTPVPTLAPGDTRVRGVDGAEMVYVPAGQFLMGSREDEGDDDERPQHTLTLNAFWIDKHEVTNLQYHKCVEAGACTPPTACAVGEPTFDDETKLTHPVVCVSWEAAQRYCGSAGVRLPTEAEWEKAARGTDARQFVWGNQFDCHRGNFDDEVELTAEVVEGGPSCDGFPQTAPVGSFPDGVSPYGALDLSGNVWEWVNDWYDGGYYALGPERDLNGPPDGRTRVVRGGAWTNSKTAYLRLPYRDSFRPDSTADSVGFRCAQSAE
jgi:formylglycine-generating enzyme required for sulfatase activity